MTQNGDRIIVPLDVSSHDEALRLVTALSGVIGTFKVGSQLFTACGPQVVRDIMSTGAKVFLDLKFHDIPNTVTHACVEAARLGAFMMTVHTSGGRVMLETLSRELDAKFGPGKPTVVGITVLTSLDTRALFEVGIEIPVEEQVQRLALFAEECGLDGVVCSPREVGMIRKAVRPDFTLVTPGIRMPGESSDDQQRVSTPHDAIAAGADYIVVGRPITGDPNPRDAAERILQSMQSPHPGG